MKRIVLVLLAAAVLCSAAFSADRLEDVLPRLGGQQLDDLRAGRMIEASTLEGTPIVDILPMSSFIYRTADLSVKESNGFSVALAALFPYPESWETMPDGERQLAVFNLMRSVSTQEGVTYISHRAGDKPKTLFEKSWYLSNPGDKKSKTADPVATVLPEYEERYCFQQDTTFGGNVYKHVFVTSESEIYLEVNNLTAMKFHSFKCLDEGQLMMYLDACLTDEGILLSGMSRVRDRKPEVKILFITVDLPSAFMRRVTALKNWFAARLEQVYGK